MIKRYEVVGDKYGDGTVKESDTGQVVFYEDYVALEQKLDALSADLFEAWSFEKSKHFCYGLDITVGHGTPYAVRCAIDEYRKYVISVLTEYKSSGTHDAADKEG